MGIRRLNYTGRKRISRADAQIGLIRDERADNARFVVQLNLNSYSFPPESKIFIEAYRQARQARFEYGTVAFPREIDVPSLAEFDVVEAVKFRVKVLSADGLGQLLGEADQIAPVDMDQIDSDREGLLPVKPEELGQQLWWLDFDSGGPILLVSRRSGDWKGFVRSPHFQWLVLPSVLRLIGERLLELGVEPDDDEDGWEARWMKFIHGLPGGPSDLGTSPNEDDKEQWIKDVCASFARANKYVGKFAMTLFPADLE